jgi:hypothetical protein
VDINFETAPFPTTPQPNNYYAAGAMKTYTQPGVFSIKGGVVLDDPTFLEQFIRGHGSRPNLYGTTDVADPSLLSTITLNQDPSQNIHSVEGLLFNGQDFVQTGNTELYTLTAFAGARVVTVDSVRLSTVLSDPRSFTSFDLSSSIANPITRVTFRTPNAAINGWDFLVDSIVASSAVPEPSTIAMGGTALLGGLAYTWHRRRHARA